MQFMFDIDSFLEKEIIYKFLRLTPCCMYSFYKISLKLIPFSGECTPIKI